MSLRLTFEDFMTMEGTGLAILLLPAVSSKLKSPKKDSSRPKLEGMAELCKQHNLI